MVSQRPRRSGAACGDVATENSMGEGLDFIFTTNPIGMKGLEEAIWTFPEKAQQEGHGRGSGNELVLRNGLG